jgi:tRNA threonylcarbamoyl adenosine modification protein YeaZ
MSISKTSVTETVLAIDTTGARLQMALLGDDIVDASVDEIGKGHAELLFARLDALLERNGLSYGDLTRIAVTSGPGSFTGLRVGLAAARGLGLTLGIPVLGIPTLTALSLAGQGAFAVIVDARRNEAYFQLFAAPGTPAAPAEVVPFDAPPVPPGLPVVSGNPVDIGLLASFAATLDPALYPPDAFYLRSADAKPQDKARIARVRA